MVNLCLLIILPALNCIHLTHYILRSLCKLYLWCAWLLDIKSKTSICQNCYSEHLESLSLPDSELRKLGHYSRKNQAEWESDINTYQICYWLLYHLNKIPSIITVPLIFNSHVESLMMWACIMWICNVLSLVWLIIKGVIWPPCIDNKGNYFQSIAISPFFQADLPLNIHQCLLVRPNNPRTS